jgi:hypothetical protein
MKCTVCKDVDLIRINFPESCCIGPKGKKLPAIVDRCPKCGRDVVIK